MTLLTPTATPKSLLLFSAGEQAGEKGEGQWRRWRRRRAERASMRESRKRAFACN